MRIWHWTKAVALAALLISPVAPACAADQPAAPSADPILRIETGRHSATVTHLAVDGQQRLLATASMDKTVRLWDIASGQALGTLRVPIGAGPEGTLYTVALSPDGKTLLTTGFTGPTWDGSAAIYLFDVDSRKLKTRLPKLPELVNDVAFSPDGQAFAAVFAGHNGMAVWNSTNGKLLGADKDYGDIATGLAFDRAGRLATVSFDGQVRLYGADYQLKAKAKMAAGSKPHSVAFSPDGQFLAVGYEDGPRVDMLSAADLKPAYRVDTKGAEGGNLAAVAWSPSGDLLAAGTARDKAGDTLLRRWANGGKGAFRDTAVGRDTVSHVLGLAQGTLVATADPAWALIDAAGKTAVRVDGRIADFRDVYRGRFAASADGRVVEYGIAQGGAKPFRFDMDSRELLADPPKDSALAGPSAGDSALTVTDWSNGAQPKVNGKPVRLDPQELARSASVVPGAGRALIGTDQRLLLVDAQGRQVASTTLAAAAWGVVATSDRRLAVAALGDGTLRWYSLRDGELLEELASLFPSGDGVRWIAWTREGFFAHSAGGGADLAGYHVNRGVKASPDWVEFAQLYQLYYAPELLPRKLAGTAGDEIKARLARIGSTAQVLNEHPAPQVDLVEFCPTTETRGFARADKPGATAAPAAAPTSGGVGCQAIVASQTRGFARVDKPAGKPAADAAPAPIASLEVPPGTTAVKLHFRVTDRQGGIGDADVFVNGKVVSNTRGFGRVKAPADAQAQPAGAGIAMDRFVPLGLGRNLVYVRAYDAGNGVENRSPAVELVVPAQRGAGPVASVKPPAKPKMYLLGAAVDRYPPPNALRFAVKDMSDVVAAIKKNKSDAYADIEAVTLTDEQVTLQKLGQAFDALAAKATDNDTVIIYLSGHGFIDDQAPTAPYYYITQNADPNSLEQTALSQGRLKEQLSKLSAKNIFLFMDTCHSGMMKGSVFDKAQKEFGQIYILAAASPDQSALDSYKELNGPFAYAVVEGLAGKAAHDNVVDDLSLGLFVKKEVPRLVAEQRPGHHQTANFNAASGEIEDFEIARVAK